MPRPKTKTKKRSRYENANGESDPTLHFEDFTEFLTSSPVTEAELRGFEVAAGGAAAARARGIDRR